MFSSNDPDFLDSLYQQVGVKNREEMENIFISKFVKLRREKTKQSWAEQQPEFNFTLKLVSPAGGLAAKDEWRLILN